MVVGDSGAGRYDEAQRFYFKAPKFDWNCNFSIINYTLYKWQNFLRNEMFHKEQKIYLESIACLGKTLEYHCLA